MAGESVILHWVGFLSLTLITLLSGVGVIIARRLVHSALWLAGVLFGIAGFFLLLGAEFIAAIQILVYVGAILTIILFAIMFTAQAEEREIEELDALKGGDN